MKTENTNNFTEGRIFSPLIRFALPVLLALFLQATYGAIDLFVVGQFGGTFSDVYVSAVSTGSQIMQTITVVITGLSMGLTVYVGTRIGAGKKQEAGRIIGSGISLFGLISVGVTVVVILFSTGLARIMQAPAETCCSSQYSKWERPEQHLQPYLHRRQAYFFLL